MGMGGLVMEENYEKLSNPKTNLHVYSLTYLGQTSQLQHVNFQAVAKRLTDFQSIGPLGRCFL